MAQQTARRLMVHEYDGVITPGPRALGRARLRLVEPRTSMRPGVQRRESLQRRLLAAADLTAAAIAILAVILGTGSNNPGIVVAAATPLVVVLFKIAGLYDRDQMRLAHSTLDEAPLLLQLTGLYTLAVAIFAPTLLSGELSSAQIAGIWLLGFVGTMGGRVIARAIAGKTSPEERCLVIGEREIADRVQSKIRSSHARARVIASLPLENDTLDGMETLETLRQLVYEHSIDRVVIAPATADTRGVQDLIRVAKAAGVRVSILPRMLEVVGTAVEFDDVDGLTMLGVRPFGLSRSSRALKRAFDLVATSIGVIAVAPILLAVAIAIRLDSRGPILFRQVRVGRDGEPFEIFKFRSMVVDAESRKDELRQHNEVGDGMFKIASDPRVTRVGAILRKTSLDEMPQLLNVLRGDMSLVGPRPLVTDEDAQVRGLDRSRLHLTPGMTGPWQVLGSRVPMHEMVAIDYLYVAGWSLWADLKLLLRTVRHVARRGNV